MVSGWFNSFPLRHFLLAIQPDNEDSLRVLIFQHIMKWGAVACLLLTASSCDVMRHIKTPPPSVPHREPAETPEKEAVRIQVYSHGWHAGLVIPASELCRHDWTSDLQLENTKYVELGWGSEEFYRTEGLNAMMLVRGLLWPTAAVIHIERFDESPYLHYPYSQLETFDLSVAEVARDVARPRHVLVPAVSRLPVGRGGDARAAVVCSICFYTPRGLIKKYTTAQSSGLNQPF